MTLSDGSAQTTTAKQSKGPRRSGGFGGSQIESRRARSKSEYRNGAAAGLVLFSEPRTYGVPGGPSRRTLRGQRSEASLGQRPPACSGGQPLREEPGPAERGVTLQASGGGKVRRWCAPPLS